MLSFVERTFPLAPGDWRGSLKRAMISQVVSLETASCICIWAAAACRNLKHVFELVTLAAYFLKEV